MPNIRPVSDLRNYAAVLTEVRENEPVYLTKNGRGAYAIVDIAEQENYEKNSANNNDSVNKENNGNNLDMIKDNNMDENNDNNDIKDIKNDIIQNEEKLNENKPKEKNKSSSVKNSKQFLKFKTRVMQKKENDSIIDLLYQKGSIEKIKKIRDLFIEFDTNKTHTLDQREIYLMFNINKIPIKYDEVKELFGFNRRNKYIKFYDFIKLTLNKNFAEKFKILIKSKVKQRLNEGEICPNDFGEMLAHLAEFEQLSPEIKNKKREGYEKYIKPMPSSVPKFLLKWELERNNRYNKNKINNSLKISNKDILDDNIKNDNKEEQNKKSGKNIINNTDNNKEINNKLFMKESAFPKEKEIQNFIEISNNKLLKYNKNLTQENIKGIRVVKSYVTEGKYKRKNVGKKAKAFEVIKYFKHN